MPGKSKQYCLPEAPSGEFVYHMEDVLDVYMRPYDPLRPQVCLDETSVQLVREKRIIGPKSICLIVATLRRDLSPEEAAKPLG